MSSNIAMKRAAKANRRKAVVAQKHRLELVAGSLAERVRRAASTPIRHCLLPDGLFEAGIGTVILARGATADRLTVGLFLVDVFCLGIKDVIFRPVTGSELESIVEATAAGQRLVPVEPARARRLLRDVAAWAESIGFAPHRDFAAVEGLFGDVSADACDATFQFGRNGKPFYMAGPSESSAQVRERMAQLRARFGDQGFNYLTPA